MRILLLSLLLISCGCTQSKSRCVANLMSTDIHDRRNYNLTPEQVMEICKDYPSK